MKQKSKSINKRKDKGTGSNNSTEQNRKENQSTSENKDKLEEGSGNENRGMFLLDATVADQKIPYPNDINLLNECREKREEIIDSIFLGSGINKKPRDHRRKARKAYLNVAKKKNRSLKTIRNGIKCQLNYLRQNIALIHQLLDKYKGRPFPLEAREQKIFWVIQELFHQQEKMYNDDIYKTISFVTDAELL